MTNFQRQLAPGLANTESDFYFCVNCLKGPRSAKRFPWSRAHCSVYNMDQHLAPSSTEGVISDRTLSSSSKQTFILPIVCARVAGRCRSVPFPVHVRSVTFSARRNSLCVTAHIVSSRKPIPHSNSYCLYFLQAPIFQRIIFLVVCSISAKTDSLSTERASVLADCSRTVINHQDWVGGGGVGHTQSPGLRGGGGVGPTRSPHEQTPRFITIDQYMTW